MKAWNGLLCSLKRARVAACVFGALAFTATGSPSWAGDAGILNAAVLDTADGQKIFEEICQGCHMSGALGAEGAGHYPALAKDKTLASRQYMALTILMGRRNMPAFGEKYAIGFGGPPATLSDEQIAAVVNYVRSHFGNHYTDLITAAEVHSLDQGAK
jgi:mono/diheme cytochrome c family protein